MNQNENLVYLVSICGACAAFGYIIIIVQGLL
jgi:hypothetical protein